VREHDHLRAGASATLDLLDRAILPESALAVERVIEDDDLARVLGIVFQLGEEERQGKRALVAGADRVAEARRVERGVRATKLDACR
jgi:hypothetical protein